MMDPPSDVYTEETQHPCYENSLHRWRSLIEHACIGQQYQYITILQRKLADWLSCRRARWCSAGNTLFLSPFHAGCRLAVMLWLCMSAALLTRREMFAVTYQPLLAVLLVLLRSRSLWT